MEAIGAAVSQRAYTTRAFVSSRVKVSRAVSASRSEVRRIDPPSSLIKNVRVIRADRALYRDRAIIISPGQYANRGERKGIINRGLSLLSRFHRPGLGRRPRDAFLREASETRPLGLRGKSIGPGASGSPGRRISIFCVAITIGARRMKP